MNDDLSTVNSQIVDATTSVVTLAAGQSPSQAFAMLDTVLLETLGIAMYNAVNRQHGAGMLSAAAVTSTCAKMLSVPFPMATARAPTPVVSTPPVVSPLPSPPREPLSPAAAVAAATTEAETALAAMKQQAEDTQKEAQKVQQEMQKLAEAAGSLGPNATPTSATKVPESATPAQDSTPEATKKSDAN